MAAALTRRERERHTLQPTALVHEVYLKLVDVRRLKPRYMVGKEVKLLPTLQRLLSETAFERLIAKQFNI